RPNQAENFTMGTQDQVRSNKLLQPQPKCGAAAQPPCQGRLTAAAPPPLSGSFRRRGRSTVRSRGARLPTGPGKPLDPSPQTRRGAPFEQAVSKTCADFGLATER